MKSSLSAPVIFENQDFLVVEKPSACLTVPSRFQDQDRRPCLGLELQKEFDRLWPVHRLDYEVSGVVLFARTAKSHELANQWFEKSKVRKMYQALSGFQGFLHWPENVPASKDPIAPEPGQKFEWNCRIEKGKRRAFETPRGKLARTEAEIFEKYSQTLLWNLFPLTGRSHQLRFEMSRHGFPILGDTLYGGASMAIPETIALRAIRLDFSGIPERRGLPPVIEISKDEYLKKRFLGVTE